MEQQDAEARQVATREVAGDSSARFLRELRQLRDGAGLGQAELAARAHYPHDFIRAAEAGPALPDLPVLTAYVRGCGGTTEEWEERWRSLTCSPSLPVQAARNAGNSAAASAGARIGSFAYEGGSPDPSIIIAALNRVAETMAAGGDPEPATASAGAGPGSGRSAASGSRPGVAPAAAGPVRPRAEASSWPAAAAAAEGRPRSEPPSPAVPAPGPAQPPAELGAGAKPAGWDPIRVSAAWPALRESASGAPPWESAGADGGAAAAKSPVGGEAGQSKSTATPGAGRARTAAAGAQVPAAAGSAGRVRRTRILVVCAVALCVLAVVLAVVL